MTNCTKCTVKPIAKEHLCDDCYESHNEWLKELSAPKQDDDQWYTLYESGDNSDTGTRNNICN